MRSHKKILWGGAITLVVIALIGVIIASAFLGDIVKKGVETVGPKITKVSINLDEVHLSLLTGSARVRGLVIGNPAGYQTPHAISASTIAVGVNPLSVLSDKIVLRSVYLESPEITFEGGLGGNNLSQILNNINAATKTGGAVATNTASPAQPSKKFELDDLLITGAKVHVSLTDLGEKKLTLDLPPIHLTGLGTGAEGITAADLSRNVLSAILSATLKAVSKESGNLGKDAQNLLKAGVKNAGGDNSNLINGLNHLLSK
jgi:uncharacterized protein involved in outer membrane biogenesis